MRKLPPRLVSAIAKALVSYPTPGNVIRAIERAGYSIEDTTEPREEPDER